MKVYLLLLLHDDMIREAYKGCMYFCFVTFLLWKA